MLASVVPPAWVLGSAVAGVVVWSALRIYTQLRWARRLPPPPRVDTPTRTRLLRRRALPVIALPAKDIHLGNGVKRVYVAEYEGGVEVTVVFWDEDRPNRLLAIIYDVVRAFIFGRWEDIETLFVLHDSKGNPESIHFPGTYSGNTTFYTRVPQHNSARVGFSRFNSLHLRHDGAEVSLPVLWVNTWNHTFAEMNTNPQMDMVYFVPQSDLISEVDPLPREEDSHRQERQEGYELCVGARPEVDARFSGMVTTFVQIYSPELLTQLGNRLV